jgi:hypothetical protein
MCTNGLVRCLGGLRLQAKEVISASSQFDFALLLPTNGSFCTTMLLVRRRGEGIVQHFLHGAVGQKDGRRLNLLHRCHGVVVGRKGVVHDQRERISGSIEQCQPFKPLFFFKEQLFKSVVLGSI